MSNRIKLPKTVISRVRAEELLGEIATLKLEERDQRTAMDRELTAVRELYEEPLTVLGKAVEEKTALLESWAAANPGEFKAGRKSIDLLHGVIGYRTGNPKLKALPKWTWDRVLERLRSLGESVAGFIRTKEEVNKEAILCAYAEARLTPEDARQLGVAVVQEEAFFVEPKLEDLEARTVKEGGDV